jgi:hypothetical protein
VRSSAALGIAFAVGLAAFPAAGQGAFGEGIASVEERIDGASRALHDRLQSVPVVGELDRRIDISGSVLGVYWDEQERAQLGHHTELWDARLFVDARLAEDLHAGSLPLARSVGASFEWNLYRIGYRDNDVGDAYVEIAGLGDSSWLSLQLGRFQLPVGEGYLRYGKGYRDNPFISNAIGAPWWWDEGVRAYGGDADDRFGYVASFTNGESDRDFGFDHGDQATLKLWGKPASWLYLSASALVGGRQPGEGGGSLWLGETWALPLGAITFLPSFDHGQPLPAAPGLDGSTYFGGDAVLTHPRGARLWLSYGQAEFDSEGGSRSDRRIHTWLVELVLEGRLLSPELRAFWLALRANGLGTYDRDEGEVLDFGWAFSYGYNMRRLDAYSVGLGWRLTKWVTLRVEYTYQDVALVRGADAAFGPSDRASYFGTALGFQF